MAALIVGLCCSPPALAKDGKGLWYFGGILAFHSTQDTIRSNADLAGDPRPDDFVSREITIEDTISYGLTAGFGLTRRLSLQLDAGYFKGQVGPVDTYFQDSFPISTDPLNPNVLNASHHRERTIPFNAGLLTEIPVALSGIVRFRTDRPVNPYVGIGAGMVFAGVAASDDLDEVNIRLDHLRVTDEKSEFGRSLVPPPFEGLKAMGRVPYTYPLSIRVDDSFEWHLTAGLEYFINGRLSLVADLRYTVTPQSVVMELGGEDQVDLSIFSEKLFRPDGSLRLFDSGGMFPNPYRDPNDPSKGLVACRASSVGDFDHDGHADDLCYINNPNTKRDDPVGRLVLQGGRINVSGFNAQMSLRLYF